MAALRLHMAGVGSVGTKGRVTVRTVRLLLWGSGTPIRGGTGLRDLFEEPGACLRHATVKRLFDLQQGGTGMRPTPRGHIGEQSGIEVMPQFLKLVTCHTTSHLCCCYPTHTGSCEQAY